MKITVTSTSTSLKDLGSTASYDMEAIGNHAIKLAGGNNFGVYIENPLWWNTIYIENFFTATSTASKAIKAGENFALDIRDINKLNLITATTQEVIILIV